MLDQDLQKLLAARNLIGIIASDSNQAAQRFNELAQVDTTIGGIIQSFHTRLSIADQDPKIEESKIALAYAAIQKIMVYVHLKNNISRITLACEDLIKIMPGLTEIITGVKNNFAAIGEKITADDKNGSNAIEDIYLVFEKADKLRLDAELMDTLDKLAKTYITGGAEGYTKITELFSEIGTTLGKIAV